MEVFFTSREYRRIDGCICFHVSIVCFFSTTHILKTEKLLRHGKDELRKALDEIKTLGGSIPICSYCKQKRDDKGLWKKLEVYIRAHSEAQFSHGLCPDCMDGVLTELRKNSSRQNKRNLARIFQSKFSS